MSLSITPGYTWVDGEVVTATKLNSAASPTLADGQAGVFSTVSTSGAATLNSASITTTLAVTGTATMAAINASGTVSPAGLVDISGASAGQIKFPATQNTSANANTLDDYEEGTWTPSIGGSATYTTQVGTYTKIGRLVIVQCNLVINALGTGSQYNISGLPFAPVNATAGTVGFWNNTANSFAYVGCVTNGSTIDMTATGGATNTVSATPVMFTATTEVNLTVSYITT